MGYMAHHAILVTSHNKDLIADARDEALFIVGQTSTTATPVMDVSGIVGSWVNGYRSFFIAPDGSKAGWAESLRGDEQRALFIAWLESKRYEDGSSSIQWAEVLYGTDDPTVEPAAVLHSSDYGGNDGD